MIKVSESRALLVIGIEKKLSLTSRSCLCCCVLCNRCKILYLSMTGTPESFFVRFCSVGHEGFSHISYRIIDMES